MNALYSANRLINVLDAMPLGVAYEAPEDVPEVLKRQSALLSTCLFMKSIGGEDFWQVDTDRAVAVAKSSLTPSSAKVSVRGESPGDNITSAPSQMTAMVIPQSGLAPAAASIITWAEAWNESKMAIASRVHVLKAMRIVVEISLSSDGDYDITEIVVKSILQSSVSHLAQFNSQSHYA